MKALHLAPPATHPHMLTAHTFIDEEIRALRDAGIECLVMSDAIGRSEVRYGVEIVSVGRPYTVGDRIRAAAEVARAMRFSATGRLTRETLHGCRIEAAAATAIVTQSIDIVHSHFAWPAGYGGTLAAAITGVPLVASLRGMELLRDDAIGYGLGRQRGYARHVREMLAHASQTIYASEFMRACGIRAGAMPDRALLVRKGVDLNRFRPALDRDAVRAGLGLAPPIVLAVGALQPRKGYDVLVRAMGLVTDSPWTLVICGEGSERHAIERQIAAAGLSERVRLTGPLSRDDIPAYFAAADLFVHTAVLEAAGNVILEAMASGCPVITTACGGPNEYVVDGLTGFTVPVGDADAIAARVGSLLRDERRRRVMSAAARREAERLYSYDRMTAELVSVYERVMWANEVRRYQHL